MIFGLPDGTKPRFHTHGFIAIHHIDNLKQLSGCLIHLNFLLLIYFEDLGLILLVSENRHLFKVTIFDFVLKYLVFNVWGQWFQLFCVNYSPIY